MRVKIVHERADELIYEIRQIVIFARQLEAAGVPMTWENIGDPVNKGEPVPQWIREHLIAVAGEQESWGYSPSKGMDRAREFLAGQVNSRGRVQISAEQIYFYNGLGDAAAKLYGYLRPEARVLCPSPSYSIHATHESFQASAPPVLYHLDPSNGWLPDLDQVRVLAAGNPSVAGILLINPDNPTGFVWPEELVRGIVGIAGEYGLFVVADEIYNRLTYNGKRAVLLGDVIGDVPGISLKGISKEFPWPGSRCGWMEVYNEESDPSFKRYVRSLYDAKMIEVCATTMPQMTIPRVFGDSRYAPHLKNRCRAYEQRSQQFYETFHGLDKVLAVRPDGAFYASVIFEPGALTDKQSLPVENRAAKKLLDQALAPGVPPDKRFVYHLLAATGICVVPMTGFTSSLQGFRMTLLEPDEAKRAWILNTLKESIKQYLAS